GRDAAAKHDRGKSRSASGAQRAERQRGADCLLERGAQIGKLLPLRNAAPGANVLQHGSLQPAEGKIELFARARGEPTRKLDCLRIAAFREPIDVRSAGIRQAQKLRYLVE